MYMYTVVAVVGTPYGSLPVLVYKGVTLGQSLAISRYIAKKGGLVASDDLTNAKLDAIVDSLHDVRGDFNDYFFNSNSEEKV